MVPFAIKKVDHVAICVEALDAALTQYAALFDFRGAARESSEALETEAVLIPVGDASIELVSPFPSTPSASSAPGALARFLAKRGPGLHHIALEVDDLSAAIAFLKALGVPLVDEAPKVGARGHLVAFLHPRATGGVLVELVQPARSV